MKKIYFMLLSAVLFAFAGCTKDPSSGNIGNNVGEDDNFLYMDIAMQLPTGAGSRSGTDWKNEDDADDPKNPGDSNSDANKDVEEGWDYENTVKTALLVIASMDDEYITHAEVTGILKGTSDGKYNIKAKFKREDIDKMYDEGGVLAGPDAAHQVKMYAYVNYTYYLHTMFSKYADKKNNPDKYKDEPPYDSKEWLNWFGTITEKPMKAGQTPIIDNTIWAKHSFLMTNATIFTAMFPAEKNDWDKYSDEKNPYNIAEGNGTIKVERAAARIDFKDGSKDAEGNTNNNTYSIIGGITSTTNDKLNLIDVQLTRMSLVNMSKSFYYLRRVSDGYNTPDKICKYETSTNWVVDTDWNAKKKEDEEHKGITPENAGNYFNFALYGEEKHVDHYPYNRSGWYTDNIKEILEKNNTDKWNEKGDYRIWRYVTENTIPDIDAQKTVQSTGVVFKGLILPGEDIKASINENDQETRYISESVEKALIASKHHLPKFGDGDNNTSAAEAWNGENEEEIAEGMSYDYPTLYEFDGLLYAGFDEVVKRAALDGQGSLLYAAAQYILNHWALDNESKTFVHKADASADKGDIILSIRAYNEIRNGVEHVDDGSTNYTEGYSIVIDETKDEFKSYATSFNDPEASNFTIYEASFEDVDTEKGEGWGYYCYYFYWNRHNDNNLNGKMGQMEFAVVRNNVYKLSVTTINRLGHPRNPDNDPDPYDPEDPDEEARVYLTVNLEVLPWVVRVNNIEF